MSNIDITFKDNRPAIEAALRAALKRAVSDIADEIVTQAVRLCDVKTGGMANAINRGFVEEKPNEASVLFGVFHEGAASAEYGSATRGEPMASSYNSPTGATDWPSIPPNKRTWTYYKILPVRRKFLRFEKDGKVHFRRSVMHPGRHASPFMRPAIDIVRFRKAKRIIKKAFKAELEKVGRRFTTR